jgi:AcrR family transcriptional regulator
MPRHPDPDLEDRILKAAHALWKRGGEKSLTMRAVARAAETNTPAVYRRFKNRRDLVRGLIRRIQADLFTRFQASKSLEGMAEAYLEYALQHPHEYELFYTHSRELHVPRKSGPVRPIRETRPNVALVEKHLAQRLGGAPEDHTGRALGLWALVHGGAMMLLTETIPGHEADLRFALREAVKKLIAGEDRSR